VCALELFIAVLKRKDWPRAARFYDRGRAALKLGVMCLQIRVCLRRIFSSD
jgi:hypothetical protein